MKQQKSQTGGVHRINSPLAKWGDSPRLMAVLHVTVRGPDRAAGTTALASSAASCAPWPSRASFSGRRISRARGTRRYGWATKLQRRLLQFYTFAQSVYCCFEGEEKSSQTSRELCQQYLCVPWQSRSMLSCVYVRLDQTNIFFDLCLWQGQMFFCVQGQGELVSMGGAKYENQPN